MGYSYTSELIATLPLPLLALIATLKSVFRCVPACDRFTAGPTGPSKPDPKALYMRVQRRRTQHPARKARENEGRDLSGSDPFLTPFATWKGRHKHSRDPLISQNPQPKGGSLRVSQNLIYSWVKEIQCCRKWFKHLSVSDTAMKQQLFRESGQSRNLQQQILLLVGFELLGGLGWTYSVGSCMSEASKSPTSCETEPSQHSSDKDWTWL